MNLITSIIWFCTGSMWARSVATDLTCVWKWILIVISYSLCIYFARKFDKELKER